MKRFPAILLFFVVAAALVSKGSGQEKSEQQFVELRVYKVFDYDKQTILENYLKNALLPAMYTAMHQALVNGDASQANSKILGFRVRKRIVK